METASIRKESGLAEEMATMAPKSVVRRSRRAPVPNSQYREGIEQLRRDAKCKDQSKSSNGSKQRSDSRPNSSTSLVQQAEGTFEEEWIRCVLPGEQTRRVEIQVIVEPPIPKEANRVRRRAAQPPIQHEESVADEHFQGATRKKVKRSQPPVQQNGLLGLLYSIAIKVASETGTYKQVLKELPSAALWNPTQPSLAEATAKESKENFSGDCSVPPGMSRLAEAFKENSKYEQNKTSSSPNRARGFPSCSDLAEERFGQLNDRYCEFKKKLTTREVQRPSQPTS